MIRNAIATVLLSLSPLGSPALAQTDDPGELRVYDVSTLQIGGEDVDYSLFSRLLPYALYERRELGSESELDQVSAFEALAEIVRDVYGEEFEYEGRRFELSDEGHLVVRGPAALHERVGRLLAFFETVVNAQVDLAVDVFHAPPGTSWASSAPAAVVSEEEARRWIDAVGPGARLQSSTLALRADRDAVLDLTRARPRLVDYDVEIAQGSAIQDAIVYVVPEGTHMTVRAAPRSGGLQLAVMWKRGEFLQGTASRSLDMATLMNTEGGKPFFSSDSSVIDDYALVNRSMAFTTWLPEGKALVLRTALGLGRAGLDEVVVLRRVAGELPDLSELPLDEAGNALIVADLGAAAPPRVVVRGGLLSQSHTPRGWESLIYHEPLLDADFLSGDVDFVSDVVTGTMERLALQTVGRWLVARPYGEDMGTRGPAVAEQARLEERFAALQPPVELLELSVRVRSGARTGMPPVEARLPLVAGTSVALALGIEGLEAFDYDVEVAQFAAIADPTMRTVFDGLALWVKPMLGASGDLVLDVRGAATLLESEEEVDLGSRIVDHLERSTHDQLFVNERRRVSPGADGGWRTTFGDTQAGLALELSLRRQ